MERLDPEAQIRNCTPDDVDKIRQFVDSCKPLTLHTAYSYWVMFTHFPKSCFVMEDGDEVVGFASGLKSQSEPNTFFFWQIGVAEEYRGKGYASKLIEQMADVARKSGSTKLQFSIEPENEASFKAFSGFAQKNNLPMEKVGDAKYHDTLTDKTESEVVYEITL